MPSRSISLLAVVLSQSVTALADVDCGGGASCPSGNTCCRNGSGGFSCCPVVDASCCPDYVHCCPPEHPVCDLSTGSCTAQSMASMIAGRKRVPWLTKTPAKTSQVAPTAITATTTQSTQHSQKVNATISGDADCGVGDFCYQITNPQSPLGSQHCQELDNPGGKSSKYWADRGWKYSSPPWKNGTCDRNLFNYVNKVTQNLDGYENVTFWYLGIQK